MFSGYRLRPDLTAEALVDGRLQTADRGRWQDGRLQVLGRRDDVVITGGRNVDLANVERTAAALRADIAVVALPDAEWGSVVRGRHGDRLLTIRRAVATSSAPGCRPTPLPRRLVRLAALPRTSSGKLDRLGHPPSCSAEVLGMTTAAHWVAGARPRTLPAAFAPVLAGSALAGYADGFSRTGRRCWPCVVSVALQIGVNYANDYSDGIRGTDAASGRSAAAGRLGLARPAAVRPRRSACFAVAGLAGVVLVLADRALVAARQSGRHASPRPGTTPAAAVRTATAGSVRSSSSSSSGWSPWVAPPTSRSAGSRCRCC